MKLERTTAATIASSAPTAERRSGVASLRAKSVSHRPYDRLTSDAMPGCQIGVNCDAIADFGASRHS
jgi:hypothetical protein